MTIQHLLCLGPVDVSVNAQVYMVPKLATRQALSAAAAAAAAAAAVAAAAAAASADNELHVPNLDAPHATNL